LRNKYPIPKKPVKNYTTQGHDMTGFLWAAGLKYLFIKIRPVFPGFPHGCLPAPAASKNNFLLYLQNQGVIKNPVLFAIP